MEVIVLAGGQGSRLKGVVSDRPKVLADINGRPFLDYLLEHTLKFPVSKIIISLGYMAQSIVDFAGDSYRGIPVEYSREEKPLGTGGAIKKAMEKCSEKRVIIINGDTFFPIDLSDFYNQSSNSSGAVALKRKSESLRYSFIKTKNGVITSYTEKKESGAGLISGGIYCLKKDALKNFPDSFSIETDYFQRFAAKLNIKGIEYFDFFIDIGTPEDYEKAKTVLGRKRRAAFFDRDGTLNYDTVHLHENEKLKFIPGRAELVKKYNDDGWLTIVITNQAGIAKGEYTVEEMHRFHEYFNSRLKRDYGAHIDAFYYCPHHPDYTGECECRKPKPGMILKAIKDFDIDAANSVLYGDKIWDIQAGEAAGIKSIMVKNDENDKTL